MVNIVPEEFLKVKSKIIELVAYHIDLIDNSFKKTEDQL
jgi:hypothetical protein